MRANSRKIKQKTELRTVAIFNQTIFNNIGHGFDDADVAFYLRLKWTT
jgi:hypothetical protein